MVEQGGQLTSHFKAYYLVHNGRINSTEQWMLTAFHIGGHICIKMLRKYIEN